MFVIGLAVHESWQCIELAFLGENDSVGKVINTFRLRLAKAVSALDLECSNSLPDFKCSLLGAFTITQTLSHE
jgi:hypothetical protein